MPAHVPISSRIIPWQRGRPIRNDVPVVYTSPHPPFAVTADVVALSQVRRDILVVLVRRKRQPFAGRLALPGGFVDPDEDLADAARRELLEETGLAVSSSELVQVGAYGKPNRDPRMRTVSVAFRVVLSTPVAPTAGDDASDSAWHSVAGVLTQARGLAFDHDEILRDAIDQA